MGHVWLVGGGPGDPGLLTLAGREALAMADIVVYDALVPVAELHHCRTGTDLIFAGKRAGEHALSQDAIESLLIARAKEGKRVVRLKGGDPFVFGRGGEEAMSLRAAGVPFTIVPGVSSAIAAAAYAGIPVTHRGLSCSFTVVTGTDDGALDEAPRSGTIVILMGVEHLAAIAMRLVSAGREPTTPAACIQWGTRADQRVVTGTLGTLVGRVAEAGLGAPAVMVVGEVAGLAEQLAWWRAGPLAGRTVAVVRAPGQASALADRLSGLGAQVVEAPVLTIRHSPGNLVTDERVSSRWDWVVFTSVNAVEAFFAELGGAGRDARSLGTTRVAAIGGATLAALRRAGVIADFSPSNATSSCLAAELPRVAGARVLLPASSLADSTLADGLRKRGALVETVTVYETVPRTLAPEQARAICEADAIAFTSASTARFLAAGLSANGASATVNGRLLSIGPRTSAALREAFGREPLEAAEPSLDALVTLASGALTWD